VPHFIELTKNKTTNAESTNFAASSSQAFLIGGNRRGSVADLRSMIKVASMQQLM